MPLTDLAIRKAKPTGKLAKLSDGGGLQLWIYPDGAKRWRIGYRYDGKQKTLAVGVYPSVSLEAARNAREDARRLISAGIDPNAAKKSDKAKKAIAAANTFEAIAAELIEKKRREGKAERTIRKMEWLVGLISRTLGPRPIVEISAADVLAVLRPVEARGTHDTATRLRAVIGQVFRYAIATSRAENDPSGALRGALVTPSVKHRAAIVEPVAFGALLRAIEGYEGTPETKCALELLALTFVRPGELRTAEWAEFNFDEALWTIPARKAKMRRLHLVPLAPRAVAVLRELQGITGGGQFVFPNVRTRDRSMSMNTANAALRRLGYRQDEMSAHGFRAAASSQLNECGLWHPDAIERQLGHADPDEVRRAYARADFWAERVRMMNWWADRCDAMRRGCDIVAFKKSG